MPLVALALLLAACGDDGDGASATPTSEQPAATATVAASPTPDALADPEPDGTRALAHVRMLSEAIGPRPAGTDDEVAAVDYLRGELASYGYDVEVQEFPFDASSFLPARLDVGADGFQVYALQGSAAGEVTGPLVPTGIGRPEEFPSGGLNGAVALIERGELTFGEKVRNAIAAGAGGVVVYNNDEGPLLGNLDGSVAIPVVGLRRNFGLELVERAAAPTQATVTVTPPSGIARNVIARPPGVSACATVTGGHFDSVAVSPGADDNASGTAAVLEVARVAAANDLAGAHCFVLFGAEEYGLLGSEAYVERLASAELEGMRAMFNLDVVGTPQELGVLGDDDLVELIRVEADRAGIDIGAGTLPPGASSDHASFREQGVPVVMFTKPNDQIHTTADALPTIDAQSLEDVVRAAWLGLAALSARGSAP